MKNNHTIPERILDKVQVSIPVVIAEALEGGAPLIISTSGGKDSDAMTAILVALRDRLGWHGPTEWVGPKPEIEADHGPLTLVHADVGRMEHRHTLPHIRRVAARFDLPLHVAKREQGDLLDLIRQRHERLVEQGRSAHHTRIDLDQRPTPAWPDSRMRYCTAGAKIGPIDKLLRRMCPTVGVCAIGLRRAESRARSKKPTHRIRKKVNTKSRTVWDWHPILSLSEQEVWEAIGASTRMRLALGLKTEGMKKTHEPAAILDWIFNETGWPAHPIYAYGRQFNDRCSCTCCVMGSKTDIANGVETAPEVYQALVDIEIASNSSFQNGRWLATLRPDLLRPDQLKAAAAVLEDKEDTKQMKLAI